MRTVAYVTDLHLDEAFPRQHSVDTRKNWEHILGDIRKRGLTEIFIGGDIGEAFSLPWFFETLKEFSVQLTLGNHDSYHDVARHTPLATSGSYEHYYGSEDDQFKYLFLDSSAGRVSEPQLQWLQKELKSEKKVVLFIHHPVLPVDTYVDHKYSLQNRDDIQKILVESGREITICCGHYHLAHEQSADRIRQVISPAASFQMLKSTGQVEVDGGHFGYQVIQFNDDGTIETSVKLFENGLLRPEPNPASNR